MQLQHQKYETEIKNKNICLVDSRLSLTSSTYNLKGTVQRELRWVKIGINRTARINCIAVKCPLPCPNGHHHERKINVLSGCITF
jgi:hypothetical protein